MKRTSKAVTADAALTRLLSIAIIENHNSDSDLLNALDAYARDGRNDLKDRALAIRRMDEAMGGEDDSRRLTDTLLVAEFMDSREA